MGTLRGHEDVFELYARHNFLFCLEKEQEIALGQCGSPVTTLLPKVDVLITANTETASLRVASAGGLDSE